MDNIEILNAVVGADQNDRCKTTIGFFVEEWSEERIDKLLDEFYVQKPIIQVSEFSDSDDNEYYCLEFIFKSRRDEDLKQLWQFLDRFVNRHADVSVDAESVPVLTVSLVPMSLNGEYSMLARVVFPDTITRTEYAGEKRSSVRMMVLKENMLFLSNDPNLVDKHHIEQEVAQEIDAELALEYGDEPANH